MKRTSATYNLETKKGARQSTGYSGSKMTRNSFKFHRRIPKGCVPYSTCALMLCVVLAAAAGESKAISATSAFVQHGRVPQRPRRLFSSHERMKIHRQLSSSGSSSSAWSEVLQNAIGSLDRRLDSKEEKMETQRRRRNNAVNNGENNDIANHIEFVSPLLEDGYPPAVLEYEERFETANNNNHNRRRNRQKKPMLLYLPGFDGTILAPFLQFPSLGEEFDVRAMKVSMDDRSSFEELKDAVVDYLLRECRGDDNQANGGRGAVYLMGESFGGILATEVALELNRPTYEDYVELRGLVLVNPATSYLRSRMYEVAPPIAAARPILPALSGVQYAVSLAAQLVPLFLDQGRAIQQLIAILSSKGLPSVVNGPEREAYMGRVAFDLPNRLKFMPQDTLKWRLEEWLEWGCGVFEDRVEMLQSARDSSNEDDALGDVETYALLKVSQELRTVVVVGELDQTLPSVEEAERLASEVFRNAVVHVVPGAGHASTCGGSLNLVGLLREVFAEINTYGRIKNGDNDGMGSDWMGGEPMEELHGLEPRYDGASIGLNPFLYWSKDYYQKWRER